jgi:hypothetical protein
MKKALYLLIWVAVFAIAMGFLESAVVVYLRAIYYPEGFAFPLRTLDQGIALTEVLREAATMIMLFTITVITFKNAISRFAVFIYVFAIWDIFYYVFLWLLLKWPPSLLTWDILFLIPVTWVGPVLAPVINSITMIILAVLIIHYKAKNELFSLTGMEWLFLVLGSLVFIFAYTQPYMQFLLAKYSLSEIIHSGRDKEFLDYSFRFIPEKFNWVLFSTGEILVLYSISHIINRLKR